MSNEPLRPEEEILHHPQEEMQRRDRRLWLLWSFLPALLAPILFWMASCHALLFFNI